MSCASSLDEFLKSYGIFILEGARLLFEGGKFAILMGEYSDREEGFVPPTHYTKRLAFAVGLGQACTDIIRLSHGEPPAAARPIAAALFQACTTCAWCSGEQGKHKPQAAVIEKFRGYASILTRWRCLSVSCRRDGHVNSQA
jgi:hypothetical protein